MAKTTEAIAGFFRTREQGETARQALLDAGFPAEQVGFVAGDTRGHTTPAVGPLETVTTQGEGVRGALTGGVVGMAAGMVALLIPGIGPLIAAGPIAGAMTGLTVGAATGGVIGLLKDHGISEEEAEFYAEGVSRGGALVTVQGVTEERETEARKIFEQHGAIETEELDN